MLSIQTAIEAFIEGWVYIRRMEREITVSKIQSLTYVHFGRSALKPRPDEFMIFETAPELAVELTRPVIQDRPHRLCVFTNDETPTLEAYAEQGYHLVQREYLMVIPLNALPAAQGEIPVGRVTTEAERLWFNAANEREVIPPHALGDPRIGYYFVRLGDDLACEGRCSLTNGNIALADSIYTHEHYRRRGLGSALMQKILLDAANRRAAHGALVASEHGRKLYLTLGYTVLADMLVFEPD